MMQQQFAQIVQQLTAMQEQLAANQDQLLAVSQEKRILREEAQQRELRDQARDASWIEEIARATEAANLAAAAARPAGMEADPGVVSHGGAPLVCGLQRFCFLFSPTENMYFFRYKSCAPLVCGLQRLFLAQKLHFFR